MTAAQSSPDRLGHRARGRGDIALPAAATIATGITAVFIALTYWWVTRDHAMPYGDSGYHLLSALEFHDAIAGGHWIEPFTLHDVDNVYPPLTPYVGALGMFVGGRTVAAPILTQNLVYVPLLALACYRIGRRAYSPLAGCLAVAFALGAPLIAEQFHVFMLDAPLTALVAATVWLVLESERFERVPIAAAAGVLAGLGLMSKQTFPLYLGGFVAIVLARGGWRNARGLAAFLAAALLIAAPWYVEHASQFHRVFIDAGNELNVPPLARPPLLSSANLGWYFWALANGLLFAPLLAFVAIGVATTAAVATRDRERRGVTVELLGGLALAFAAITAMPHKDVRYAMPLLVFLAVLGTGWIARLRRIPRTVAIAALALAIAASTIGATFGVGPPYSGPLPGNWYAPRGQGVMPLNRLTFYTDHNYMVSGPRRAEDVLGLLAELRRGGIRQVGWTKSQAPPSDQDFNFNGIQLFLSMAHLRRAHEDAETETDAPRLATLIHVRRYGNAPPCARLADGGGLWIRLGDPARPGARDFCPRFHPRFYGP